LHYLNPPNVPQYVEHCPAKAAPASSINSVAASKIFIVPSLRSVWAPETQHCKTTRPCVPCAVEFEHGALADEDAWQGLERRVFTMSLIMHNT